MPKFLDIHIFLLYVIKAMLRRSNLLIYISNKLSWLLKIFSSVSFSADYKVRNVFDYKILLPLIKYKKITEKEGRNEDTRWCYYKDKCCRWESQHQFQVCRNRPRGFYNYFTFEFLKFSKTLLYKIQCSYCGMHHTFPILVYYIHIKITYKGGLYI